MFRFWDGERWTTSVTANPTAQGSQPEGQTPVQPSGPITQNTSASGYQPIQMSKQTPAFEPEPERSTKVWWGVLIAIVVVVIAVIGFFVLRGATGFDPWEDPGKGQPTTNPCPATPTTGSPQKPELKDGRIYGGALSYKQLGEPWSAPETESRLAYNSIAAVQMVLDQASYGGTEGQNWVASVLIAELFAGDGFGDLQMGAEKITTCVLGEFYGDTTLTQEIHSSKAVKISGKNAWHISMTLGFSIPGLNATSEDVELILVETAELKYSLFYSSVPNTSSYLLPDVQEAIDSLEVSS
jgi:hypothetical protein